ncbi:MAG: UDP-N-acetylmuramoyl-tripeptide--D-alanyl-D-alanine ligase [Lentimicrobiaceae bacterium]|nr:UDP-N-acetylmuramoyl-tripeptide--D-alanyl-D-alanine ligase [Lentimicrobiaceae bacterium]
MKMIEKIYQHFSQTCLISTDSRKIEKGCVFVALKGEKFDGNDFAYQVARDNIAACVIADRKDLPQHERLFIVNDSLEALQQLATLHREKHNIPLIGITGTNGKTTTKELVAAVLSQKYNTVFTQGNFNNHLGVPLTLLQINDSTELAVVEMGANHPYEIDFLCKIAKPDYGIITNIGKAHLQGFGSFDGVIKTKKEIYDYLKEHKGKIFLNIDNELLRNLAADADSYTYGKNPNADIKAEIVSANPYLTIKWDDSTIKTRLVGDYNFENVLAAISVGSFFNIDKQIIIKAIENYTPKNNRSQFIKTDKNEIVMDAYNANPVSMKHAINNFRNISTDNSLLILGDMGELGEDSEKEHQEIIHLINDLNFKDVILIGETFSKICKELNFNTFNNVESLIDHLRYNNLSGRKILVKGSHFIHLERLIDYL